MKKLFFIFAAITFYSAAVAQIGKGRMMLGGGFNTQNFSNTSIDTDTSSNQIRNQTNKNSNISISLRYGYFISDNWMIGIMGSYNRNTIENTTSYYSPNYIPSTSTSKYSSPGFSGGVFARYYRMIGTSRFAWFGEVSVNAGGGKNINTIEANGIPYTNPYSTSKYISFNAYVKPGLTYFFNRIIAVEASFGNVGYSYSKTNNGTKNSSPSNTTTTSGLNSHLNFSLNSLFLGINFYFGGKQVKS